MSYIAIYIYVYVVYIILHTSMCEAVSRRQFSNVNKKKSKANRLELFKETSSHFKPEVHSIRPGSKLLMDSLEQSKTKDVARDVAMAYTNDLVEVACQKALEICKKNAF